MIVLPLNIDFLEWTRTLYIDLPLLNIPEASSEERWKEWGAQLIEDNKLAGAPLPNNFENWKIWAEFFVNNV